MSASFFVSGAEQKREAGATRPEMPKERISDTWAINLAQHVEPRLESPWRPLGLLLTCFLVALALGLPLVVAVFGGAP